MCDDEPFLQLSTDLRDKRQVIHSVTDSGKALVRGQGVDCWDGKVWVDDGWESVGIDKCGWVTDG